MSPRGAYRIKQHGRCSECGKSVALTQQGYAYRHSTPPIGALPTKECPGTGLKPAPTGQRDGA